MPGRGCNALARPGSARRLRPMHQSHEEVGDFDSLSTDTGPHVEEDGPPVGHTTSHPLDAVKTVADFILLVGYLEMPGT